MQLSISTGPDNQNDTSVQSLLDKFKTKDGVMISLTPLQEVDTNFQNFIPPAMHKLTHFAQEKVSQFSD